MSSMLAFTLVATELQVALCIDELISWLPVSEISNDCMRCLLLLVDVHTVCLLYIAHLLTLYRTSFDLHWSTTLTVIGF